VSALAARLYAAPVALKIVLAPLAAAAAVAAASAGAAAPPSGICSTLVRGPTVTFTWTGRRTASHLYYASVAGYSCATATKYLRRFVSRRSPGLQTRIKGGPRSFACISLAPTGYTLFQGACRAKTRPKVGFVWTLAFG
jgi:hypothetical protein